MRTDPRPGGDFPQQRIECSARLPLVDRIDPDQHTIDDQQLLADLIGEFLVVDRRLRIDADRGQFLEDAMKAIVLRRCRAACFGVTTPQDRDLGAFGARFMFRHATFLV